MSSLLTSECQIRLIHADHTCLWGCILCTHSILSLAYWLSAILWSSVNCAPTYRSDSEKALFARRFLVILGLLQHATRVFLVFVQDAQQGIVTNSNCPRNCDSGGGTGSPSSIRSFEPQLRAQTKVCLLIRVSLFVLLLVSFTIFSGSREYARRSSHGPMSRQPPPPHSRHLPSLDLC